MMTKAALYVRVSTIDKQTLEQQAALLIEYCNRENLEFDIFEEHASGAKESRPQLDLMMQGIRQGKYQAVIVLRLDRLGRNLKHLLQLVEEFKNKKIRFVCLTQQIDTSTATGMFFLQVIGAVSEFERQLIRERIQEKLDYLKASGKKLGRPSGSKDKKQRRKSGYWQRWSKKHTPQKTALVNDATEVIIQQ